MEQQPDLSRMSDADRRQWDAVQARKAKRLSATGRRLLPQSVRDRAMAVKDQAASVVDKVPGADQAADFVRKALDGLFETGAKAGSASVRPDAVIDAYQRRGHAVATLSDIRDLELTDIHSTIPRLDLAYVGGSMLQGAGTGLLASGGTILAAGGAVGTGGVAAAPGIGAVAGAIALDAAATVIASNRAVAHVAAYYGYDVNDPAERVYALGVLSAGLADNTGKAAAYNELNKLVQALARRQTWNQLGKNQITRVVQAVYEKLGMTLTQKKLGQAVPIVGVAIGAGLNARTLNRMVDDARQLYLERFLMDKYGIVPDVDPDIVEGEILSILQDEDGGDDPTVDSTGS